MKRIWIPAVLVLFISLVIGTGSMASGYTVPTLFHNDEAWYKDSVAPLLRKDGNYHVPADMLGMFSDLTVSYHRNDDNLLVTHTDGTYVSVDFGSKTAVIDGEIHENISVFRENEYMYVDGEWIAEIFSMKCSVLQRDDGQTVLRLTDEEAVRTLEELLQRYTEEYAREETPETADNTGEKPPEAAEESVPEEDGGKRIYIVTGDNYENLNNLPAEDIVEHSGLVCTMFLHDRSAEEKLWQYAFFGNAGICAGSVEEADALNDRLESLFFRRLEYVLPAGPDTDREALAQAGYIVVEPDFIVDYSTDPDAVYDALYAYMLENDTAIVKVSGDGCSQRMIALLCNLTADPAWCQSAVLLP